MSHNCSACHCKHRCPATATIRPFVLCLSRLRRSCTRFLQPDQWPRRGGPAQRIYAYTPKGLQQGEGLISLAGVPAGSKTRAESCRQGSFRALSGGFTDDRHNPFRLGKVGIVVFFRESLLTTDRQKKYAEILGSFELDGIHTCETLIVRVCCCVVLACASLAVRLRNLFCIEQGCVISCPDGAGTCTYFSGEAASMRSKASRYPS